MWYGAYLIMDPDYDFTLGELTSFLMYTLITAMAFAGCSVLWGDFMKAVGASERVFELIEREPKIKPEGGTIIPSLSGSVCFRNVGFTYPSRPDVVVLRDIDLQLDPGKIVALVGPSGGGKSTIINLLEKFYLPTKGSIFIDGQDLKTIDPVWLHQQIGIVSQGPCLFSTTIRSNIAYGRQDATLEEIIEAAKVANAHDFISKFPDGYETVVGERGVMLSGGQKQRIAIARSILKDPKILLLDEATSDLDAESEFLVQEALDRIMRGRTTLVVAHRLSTVRNANLILVISEGQIAEQGNHNTLMQRDGVYAQLVSHQLQK